MNLLLKGVMELTADSCKEILFYWGRMKDSYRMENVLVESFWYKLHLNGFHLSDDVILRIDQFSIEN